MQFTGLETKIDLLIKKAKEENKKFEFYNEEFSPEEAREKMQSWAEIEIFEIYENMGDNKDVVKAIEIWYNNQISKMK